jgi:nucleoside-diphosphate-sugar epimerase
MLSAALSSAKDGEIFNGGTGSKTEVANMAEIIKEVAESQSNLVFKPARNWDKVKDRVSDLSKSASELGYAPKVNIREGLEKTIKWYKDNYDKVKSLKNYFE